MQSVSSTLATTEAVFLVCLNTNSLYTIIVFHVHTSFLVGNELELRVTKKYGLWSKTVENSHLIFCCEAGSSL